MRYRALSDGYLLRVERGEEVLAALRTLMQREEIGCGSVTGLGAVGTARLGYYVLEERSYLERALEGPFEVVSLVGTLSWHEGEPFPHVHVTLSDADFRTLAGHCFEATVSATVELRVRAESGRVERHDDEEIGLHLMDLPEACPVEG